MNTLNPETLYTKEYFEDGTISNYFSYKDSPHFYLLAKEIYSLFNPTSVLDVGCAKGFIVKHLRKLGVDAYGIDISEYAIKKADKNLKPYLKVAKVQKIPFKTKTFDVVFSSDVLEHVPEIEVDRSIQELIRVGKIQFHLITTVEHSHGKDITHVTLKPVDWWRERFMYHIKKSKSHNEIFLLKSENHWIYDYLSVETKANDLNEKLQSIYNSFYWRTGRKMKNIMKALTQK